ncbi:Norsolorinic acid ketoreductase [Lachnellula suecica]|uniref:Norsolorinic acid ketoreductase n=1 Tax=Lachnellula suecica TaxID=602035 RepID=A0A8T9C642_9HELO|nr:Norsolorinic acid ketoreductase [Lachnellula suecica]
MSTIVFITGANRGLGLGLLERYLKLPNHTVIAANRNPEHPTSKSLSKLPTADGTKLIVVKLDATIWQDAFDAVKTLEDQGIDHFDVVIANAGVCNLWPKVVDVKPEDLIAHVEANTYSVVSLYQAVRPLLQKSEKEPIYAIMGTTAGSLNSQLPLTNGVYGPSKAASAWYSIRINEENSWLNSFSLVPGWVHTDLGDSGATGLGVRKEQQDKLMIGVDESCDGMMKVLAETSKAKHGGKLVLYSGEPIPW